MGYQPILHIDQCILLHQVFKQGDKKDIKCVLDGKQYSSSNDLCNFFFGWIMKEI